MAKAPQKPHELVAENLKQAIYTAGLGPGTRVLQVGASNGRGGDPVYPLIGPHKQMNFFRVEPRSAQFDKLLALHTRDDNVLIHQAAVIPDDWPEGPTDFYQYKFPDALPRWAAGVASLEKGLPIRIRDNKWRAQQDGGKDGEVEKISVRGQHLSTALTEMNVRHPDVVVTDMAAHDHLVFEPLAATARIICFEHKHYNADEKERWAALLEEKGFERFFHGPEDTIWRRP